MASSLFLTSFKFVFNNLQNGVCAIILEAKQILPYYVCTYTCYRLNICFIFLHAHFVCLIQASKYKQEVCRFLLQCIVMYRYQDLGTDVRRNYCVLSPVYYHGCRDINIITMFCHGSHEVPPNLCNIQYLSAQKV